MNRIENLNWINATQEQSWREFLMILYVNRLLDTGNFFIDFPAEL
jgi:hypothetical protein